MKIRHIVPVAMGEMPADVLLSNARILNVFTGRIEEGNIALFRKRIAGIGDYTEGKEVIDLKAVSYSRASSMRTSTSRARWSRRGSSPGRCFPGARPP